MGHGSGKPLLGKDITFFPITFFPITNHSEKYANKKRSSLVHQGQSLSSAPVNTQPVLAVRTTLGI
jgi:hypothetical protein